MTSTSPRESVIDRVKKLLALAGNNTNVNEAAAAMARAQRLMLEHKLAAAELETDGGDVSAAEAVGEIALDEVGNFLLAWKPILMHVLSQASCCHAVRVPVVDKNGRNGVRFRIVGTESDATFVAYCYRYLVAEIDRLCEAEARGKGFEFRNAFRRGAVSAIAKRLTDERAQVVKEAADSGRALIVLRNADAAVTKYVKTKFPNLKTTRASGVRNGDGFAQGKAAGDRIALPGRDRPALGAEPRKLRA